MKILGYVLIYGLLLLDARAFATESLDVSSLPWTHHQKILQSAAFNSSSCESTLDSLSEELSQVNWENYSSEELAQKADVVMNEAWNFRRQLHQKMQSSSKECVLKMRSLFHQLRDYEDYVSEFAQGVTPLDPKTLNFQTQAVPIFGSKTSYGRFRGPQDFAFASGDVVLARGVSFISAIITQVSDNRSHFSHALVVNVKDAAGAKPKDLSGISTVESYIGAGVSSFDLPFALKNENARLLVLRSKDKALALRAGEAAMAAAALKLPYDYQMNYDDDTAMSCVEVPVMAYSKASNGAMKLPTYPASVQIQSPQFLQRLGLASGEIPTPDDFETDPNFELVSDWRDLRLIRDSRHKDAVLAEMMRWISVLGYKFHDNWKSYFAMYVIKPLRSTFLWPTVQRWTGAPNIDEHVPTDTVGIMVLVDQTAELMLEKLRRRDRNYFAEHGRPMTNRQLRDYLEVYRMEEAKKYSDGESSELFKILRHN